MTLRNYNDTDRTLIATIIDHPFQFSTEIIKPETIERAIEFELIEVADGFATLTPRGRAMGEQWSKDRQARIAKNEEEKAESLLRVNKEKIKIHRRRYGL